MKDGGGPSSSMICAWEVRPISLHADAGINGYTNLNPQARSCSNALVRFPHGISSCVICMQNNHIEASFMNFFYESSGLATS